MNFTKFNFEVERSPLQVTLRGTFSSDELMALLDLYAQMGYNIVSGGGEGDPCREWRLIKSESPE